MERRWWIRFTILVVSAVIALMYVYPTFSGKEFSKDTAYPFPDKITLGLDLQGGMYMVMGVDFNKVYEGLVSRQASSLNDRMKEKGFPLKKFSLVTEGLPIDDPHARIEFDPDKREEIYKVIKEEYTLFRLTKEEAGQMELGIAHTYRSELREKTIDQSIEVIRNRIDEFGVTEPTIVSQGNDRVVIELPGETDVDRAKSLIGRTAKLVFKIVDTQKNPTEIAEIISKVEEEHSFKYEQGQKFSEYVDKINRLAKEDLPADTEIAFERVDSTTSELVQRVPYLLNSKLRVEGSLLQDAYVSFNQQNRRPEVAFEFNPKGASEFGDLTGDNIGKQLAIVLDGNIVSAPTVQARITNRGVITLGAAGSSGDLTREAKDLAIVLRAGALPARLEFMEQRVVGPSLGQDSIEKSARASVLGAICILLFILVYYRVAGAIAAFSLFLNVAFVLAILIGIEATLTLPGIAGIGLTVGIAVDSNVIIYERIREEMRAGKTMYGAVEAGFQKALRTILDANITNAAGAIILMSFGTGPIKGFAITLMIGIVTTLFTAVFCCRVLFDLYLKRFEGRPQAAISI